MCIVLVYLLFCVCICVFFVLYLYLCICGFVFVFVYLLFCICIFVSRFFFNRREQLNIRQSSEVSCIIQTEWIVEDRQPLSLRIEIQKVTKNGSGRNLGDNAVLLLRW